MEDTPRASVVKDGRVDLSAAPTDPKVAAGQARGGPVDVSPPEPADPTQDPDWKNFEEALGSSYVPQPVPADQSSIDAMVRQLPPDLARLLGPQGLALGGAPQQQPAAQAQPAATSTTTTPSTPEATEQRILALAALKRDGWKDSMIQKLGDNELLEVGLQRHASQAEIDAKLNERRQAHRESGNQPTTQPESGATPASGGPGQVAPLTFEPVVQQTAEALTRHFSEQFGEEIGKPVGEAMKASLNAIASHFEGQLQKATKGLELLAGFAKSSVVGDIRRQWATDYPQTADDATWTAIEKVQQRLEGSGAYQGRAGLLEAFEHARRIVLPGVSPASAASRANKAQQIDQQRANGGLTIGSRTAATAVPTEEQGEFENFLRAHQLSEAALKLVAPGLRSE